MSYKSYLKTLFTRNYALMAMVFITLCIMMGAVAVVSANIAANPVEQSTGTFTATVKRAGANLRQGPGLQYEVVGRMRRGALLSIIGQFTNDHSEIWYKVYVEAFGEVWVASWVVQVTAIQTTVLSTTFSTETGATGTQMQTFTVTAVPASNTNSGGGSNNPPPPATTPDP